MSLSAEKLHEHRDLPRDDHRGPLVTGQGGSIVAVGQEVDGGAKKRDR